MCSSVVERSTFNASAKSSNLFTFNMNILKRYRSTWKLPPEIDDNIRSKLISPLMINDELHVYNGKQFKTIKIEVKHVGCRIGDLIHTKLTAFYKKGKK